MKIIISENNYNKFLLFIENSKKPKIFEYNVFRKPDSNQKLYGLNNLQIRNELINQNLIKKNSPILIIRGSKQKMFLYPNNKEFIISTAAAGFGNTDDSNKTPTGLLKIDKRQLGKMYQVFVGKKPTNTILGPNEKSTRRDNYGRLHSAEVLTGFITLYGLQKENKNTLDRDIYIHGTNKEQYLGSPKSGGCIRVSNKDIVYLINNLPTNTYVFISPT